MLRTRQSEANQIDDDIRTQLGDAFAEGSSCFLFRPIDGDALDSLPRLIRPIGLAFSPTERDHPVSGSNQPRHEEGTDVASSANDDDALRSLWIDAHSSRESRR